jgi:hypothetical protein
MEDVSKTPWSAFLLHVGACTSAIAWAGRRTISRAEFDDCPSNGWRAWLGEYLGVGARAGWDKVEPAMAKVLSGDGSGSGYGSGYGDGSGYGSGYGYGYGYGSGSGSGDDVVS